jgi:hypothetical protein
MQWEYASLIEGSLFSQVSCWSHGIYFRGPTASWKELTTDSNISALNMLGQAGWEAFAVEPCNGQFPADFVGLHSPFTESLLERIIWLKRPVPNP